MPASNAPAILTSGFVALDTLVEKDVLDYSAGGTAGNVAAALAFLGWSASVAALVGRDAPAARLKRDLTAAGVSTSDLYISDRGRTAQVIHLLHERGHRYLFSCSDCGRAFPKSQPPPEDAMEPVLARRPLVDVFFFDRASRFSVALAEKYAASGALVVFEPATRGRPHLVDRARRVAHVVKLSAESPGSSGDRGTPAHERQVVVLTDGAQGARLKVGTGRWRKSSALPALDIVDAAGAGDWTTAGFLYALLRERVEPAAISEERVYEALRFGQALAALSCSWRGARGIAKTLSSETVTQHAASLLRGDEPKPLSARQRFRTSASESVCRICLVAVHPAQP